MAIFTWSIFFFLQIVHINFLTQMFEIILLKNRLYFVPVQSVVQALRKRKLRFMVTAELFIHFICIE